MAAVLSQSTSTLSSAHLSQHRNSFMEGKELNLVDDELNVLFGFIEVVATLVKWVKLLIVSHPSLERDLYMIAAQTSAAIEKIHPDGKILQGVSLFIDLAFTVQVTCEFWFSSFLLFAANLETDCNRIGVKREATL